MSDLLEVKVGEHPLIRVHPNAGDIVVGERLFEEARSKKMSTSAFLEELDPSGPHDTHDAFERQLMLAGIRVRSDPVLGVYADKVDRFWNSEKPGTEWLLIEFVERTYRQVVLRGFGPGIQQRFYLSSEPVSDVLHPSYIQQVARQKQIEPAIPLSELVALVTPVDRATYQAFYLTDDTDEQGMVRVAEGADVPLAKLTGSDHDIRLKKYGRALEGTYEAFRRMQIDRFALHIALLAVRAEADKVNTVVDVIVNGDGNSGTSATNHNNTALDDGASIGTLRLKGFLAWLMQWENPYACDVVLAQNADVLDVLMLDMGSANVPYFTFSGNFGVEGVNLLGRTLGGQRMGPIASAPADKLVGIDSRWAIEMVLEIGGSLTEVDRFIRRQTNQIVITEVVGFCVFDANANKTLDTSA
jgi:hypothetical protein